jgi:hypothetical protein
MPSAAQLDANIAQLESELGVDLSGTGNDAIDNAELPEEAAIASTGEAAPPAADSPLAESAAGTSIKEYLDERDRRIELERRVREAEARMQQQQAYEPDPFMDPDSYTRVRINAELAPIRNCIQQQALRSQIADVHAAHGVDLVKRADSSGQQVRL